MNCPSELAHLHLGKEYFQISQISLYQTSSFLNNGYLPVSGESSSQSEQNIFF